MTENSLNIGVMFGTHHTKRNYDLYLTARPDTGSPKPKTFTQDIPGADGVLDLTEATTGEVKYGNRTVTVKAKRIMDMSEQEAFKSQLLFDLHGKKMKVILDEDPERYYYGRVTVTFPKKTHDQLYVTFTVDAAPYKMAIQETENTYNLSSVATEQDIRIGVLDTQTMPQHTDFRIPAGDSRGDFSEYIGLAIKYPENITTNNSKIFQVTSGSDAEGNRHTYTRSVTAAEVDARRIYVTIADLTAAGVDVSDIRRVNTSGIGSSDKERVQLCGTAFWGFIRLYNAQMGVVPEIYTDAADGVVKLNYNGKTYELENGWNKFDEMLLPAGRSQFNVVSGGDSQIKIRYRMGWL